MSSSSTSISILPCSIPFSFHLREMATEVSTPEVEAPEVESPASGSSEVVDMKSVKPAKAKKHPRYAKV